MENAQMLAIVSILSAAILLASIVAGLMIHRRRRFGRRDRARAVALADSIREDRL